MAQKVANALAEVFRANNIERTTQNSSKAEDLLAREIAAYQEKIRHDTEALFNYAREKGLPPSHGCQLSTSRRSVLRDLSKQLLEAENQRKNAQAIYLSAKNSTDIVFHSRSAEVRANHRNSEKNLGTEGEKGGAAGDLHEGMAGGQENGGCDQPS